MKYTTISMIILLLISSQLYAQKSKIRKEKNNSSTANTAEIKIPMIAEKWDSPSKKVDFIKHKGISAMSILPEAGQVVLKDFVFQNGTIEFDVEPQVAAFTGVYFRRQDSKESELFYLRMNKALNPLAVDIAQYAGIIKGVNMWDLLPHYQNAANVKIKEWNHIKLIVSGKQMRVFVNDMRNPVLQIQRLEGNFLQGGLAFDGESIFANLVIKPDQVEGLTDKEGFDPTSHDPRYLRNWQVSLPRPFPSGQEPYAEELAKLDTLKWQDIEAERRGLINLTRVYGLGNMRRMVYLKVKLKSETAQKKILRLGFLNEVWVFLNNKTVFVDKNLFPQNMRKTPDGRISIENSSFPISLDAGENQLIIGLASNFYGWGIIARLEDMDGVQVVKKTS